MKPQTRQIPHIEITNRDATIRNLESRLTGTQKMYEQQVTLINELKSDKRFLQQLCTELSSAIKTRS